MHKPKPAAYSNRPPYPPIGGGPASKGVPRILLTTPVTVASAERSFNRLKLVKNILYMLNQYRWQIFCACNLNRKQDCQIFWLWCT